MVPEAEASSAASDVSPAAQPTDAPSGAPADRQKLGGNVRSRPAWLPLAISGATVAVLFIVAALILILASSGGSGSKSKAKVSLPATVLASQDDFARIAGLPYFALLPAGWTPIATTNLPAVVAAKTVKSPIDNGAIVTVGRVQHPPSNLSAAGRSLMSSDAKRPGFRQGSVAMTKLRDGTPAWIGSYTLGAKTTIDYVKRSCGSMLVTSAQLPSAEAASLGDKIETTAAAMHEGC